MTNAVSIVGYEHGGIRISDRAAGVAFYELLGFRVAADFPEAQALEMDNAAGVRINLIYNGVPRSTNVLMDEPVKHPGVTHLAFVVASLDDAVRALDRAGVPLSEGPLVIGGRRRICFLRDPDGNVIELDELV